MSKAKTSRRKRRNRTLSSEEASCLEKAIAYLSTIWAKGGDFKSTLFMHLNDRPWSKLEITVKEIKK